MGFISTKKERADYTKLKAGDVVVEGYYKRSQKATGDFAQDHHLNHIFEKKDRTEMILWHSGYLTNAMQDIEVGQYCQVVFEGLASKEETPKGQKPARKFDVRVDWEEPKKSYSMAQPVEAPAETSFDESDTEDEEM